MKRLLLALALLTLPAWALPAVLQSATAIAQTKAFGSNNTAGKQIIACAIHNASAGTVTFSDTNLNSYRDPSTGSVGAATDVPYNGSLSDIACAYAENISAGANTVSYTMSAGACFCAIDIIEVDGLPTSNSLDQFGTTSNASSGAGTDNETSPSKNTTANGELIFGYSADSSGPDSAGTGFSFVTNHTASAETMVQGSSGAIAATVTSGHGVGDQYGFIIMTFKAAAAVTNTQLVGTVKLTGTVTFK